MAIHGVQFCCQVALNQSPETKRDFYTTVQTCEVSKIFFFYIFEEFLLTKAAFNDQKYRNIVKIS